MSLANRFDQKRMIIFQTFLTIIPLGFMVILTICDFFMSHAFFLSIHKIFLLTDQTNIFWSGIPQTVFSSSFLTNLRNSWLIEKVKVFTLRASTCSGRDCWVSFAVFYWLTANWAIRGFHSALLTSHTNTIRKKRLLFTFFNFYGSIITNVICSI